MSSNLYQERNILLHLQLVNLAKKKNGKWKLYDYVDIRCIKTLRYLRLISTQDVRVTQSEVWQDLMVLD